LWTAWAFAYVNWLCGDILSLEGIWRHGVIAAWAKRSALNIDIEQTIWLRWIKSTTFIHYFALFRAAGSVKHVR
jgi:hypothetical protein